MRYFQPPANTRFYAGVDLHARTLFLVILDQHGQIRYARNLPANPQAEPNGTLPSGSEPVAYLNGGDAGNLCVSGPARTRSWHSRSALRGWAARVRMTVGCGSPHLPPIAKPDRRGELWPPQLHSFGHPARKRRRLPFPWKIFSLDTKSLMTVRRLPSRRCRAIPGQPAQRYMRNESLNIGLPLLDCS
jgi:hypothetical protein